MASELNEGSKDRKRRAASAGSELVLIATLCSVIATAAAFAMIGPSAGQSAAGEAEPGALETFAGLPPVAYLVKRIGGPHVRVEVLVQPGQDPHIFEPTPRQVMRLSNAKLFFKVGMPFEDQLTERLAASGSRLSIIDTAAGITRRMENDACDQVQGDAQEDNDDVGPDPHVWLAPRLLKQMAANIAAALCIADPPHAPAYRANLAALDSELDALDRRLRESLKPYRGQSFYVFHPAFGYFADAYGLRQESVEVEGKSPTPRQLFRMIERARANHVKIIFLQPQFNEQVARSIAQAVGGAAMPMDSLAYDVVANLQDAAAKIAAANSRSQEQTDSVGWTSESVQAEQRTDSEVHPTGDFPAAADREAHP